MKTVFLDTNALLKLYLPEKGATWLKNFVLVERITISELALFESTTVMRRRLIEGSLTKSETLDLIAKISRDSTDYSIIPLGGKEQLEKLNSIVFSLSNQFRIRALDGIHLAAAVLAKDAADSLDPPEPLVFVSSDMQWVKVAQAIGLTVENPEDNADFALATSNEDGQQ